MNTWGGALPADDLHEPGDAHGCKENVIACDNDHYGIGNRRYVTNVSKARELSSSELGRITDLYTAMSLRLQAAFGLRREESIKIRPEWADRGNQLALKDSWTKGGRAREIPIRNDEQRQVLDAAKSLAGVGSLIAADRSYVEQLRRFEHQCAAAGYRKLFRSSLVCLDNLPRILGKSNFLARQDL